MVKSYIESGITFNEIFKYAVPDKVAGCPAGYVSINAGHDDGDWQCLQLMVQSHLVRPTCRFSTFYSVAS